MMKVYQQAYHNLVPHMKDAKTILGKTSDDFDSHNFFDSGDDFASFMKLALPYQAVEAEEFL